MSLDTIISLLQSLRLTSIFKVGILSVIFLYVIFLYVVLKQVRTMNRMVVQTFFGPLLETIAFLLLLVGISLFIVAIVIL